MNFRHSIMGALVIVIVYLFATAPAPLPETEAAASTQGQGTNVQIKDLFDIVNFVNAKTRQLYTDRVVSRGKEAGIKFGEHWLDDGVEVGPLPALFLRMTATQLEKRKSPLGLFLGSDQPINQANYFKGEQVIEFEKLRVDHQPRFFDMPKMGINIGMYADIASAKGCVTCHNEHKESPKKDWLLNDVMGATVWVHPQTQVSVVEARRTVSDLYQSIQTTYGIYLARAQAYREPLAVGAAWPEAGKKILPDAKTFMDELFKITGPEVTRRLLLDFEGGRAQ